MLTHNLKLFIAGAIKVFVFIFYEAVFVYKFNYF